MAPAAAERYVLNTYTIDHGLPQSQVFTLCQDHRGALWVATGLVAGETTAQRLQELPRGQPILLLLCVTKLLLAVANEEVGRLYLGG